jgi:hypothetical protein
MSVTRGRAHTPLKSGLPFASLGIPAAGAAACPMTKAGTRNRTSSPTHAPVAKQRAPNLIIPLAFAKCFIPRFYSGRSADVKQTNEVNRPGFSGGGFSADHRVNESGRFYQTNLISFSDLDIRN